jgi:7tm Odorant receptor
MLEHCKPSHVKLLLFWLFSVTRMNILEKFEKQIRNCSRNLWVCGLEVFEKDFKWFNIRLSFFVALSVLFFINSAYTCFTNDLETSLQWLATMSITIQGLVKLWVIFYNHQDLVDIVNGMRELHKHVLQMGWTTSLRMYAKLDKCGKELRVMYWGFASFFGVGILVLMAYPVLMYHLDGRLYFMISLFIVFLDRHTSIGYTITAVYQLTAVFYVANVTLAFDFLIFCAVASYAMQVELMCEMIEVLNDYLQSSEALQSDKDWSSKVNESLMEIIKKHQNIQQMMEKLNELFFLPILYQIPTAVVSLSLSLFLLITVSFDFDHIVLY